MRYLILDGQKYQSSHHFDSYRGTYRRGPTYCDAVSENHEVNQLFAWYLESEASGFLQDLARACRYTKLLNEHFPGRHFEVIRVNEEEAISDDNAKFVGFDISLGGGGDSLIFLSLLFGPSASVPEEPVAVLSDLIRRYFYPKLNAFGLFRTFEEASHCRRAMIALQSFRPNLYEGGDLDRFKVTGVYLIPQSDDGSA